MVDPTVLFTLSYGLYIVSSASEDGDAGCIINTATQVTSSPIQVMVALNKDNVTCQRIVESGHFALTMLDETSDMPFIGRFGFRNSNDFKKFEGIECRRDEFGDPWTPEHACGMLGCAVAQTVDVGTHLLFVGEVTETEHLSKEKPLTYAYYHGVLKGKTPPKASSYVAE